jgi:superfamily II DNA or RNA helicase
MTEQYNSPITLRPYQEHFVKSLALGIRDKKKVIACSPTGSGKTKCFISIANSALSKGKTVLILTETTKIFKQIEAETKAILINPQQQKTFGILPNRIYLAMAQTLVRRPLLISQFAEIADNLLIINDEAHIGTATKLLQQLSDAMLLGFTATPDYASGKHLPELYKDCIVGAQVSDLIDMGFLTPYRHYARIKADLNQLKIKGGEFTEKSQEDAFETTQVYEGLLEDLQKIPYKKALIFCSSISHCKDMVTQLEYNGYTTAEVHSECDKSDFNLASFMYGDVNICVSVGILTKGFDYPPIDLIAIVRATTSLPLFCQMIGRGSRLHPGKTIFSVLDYGGNYERFGLWDADRDWQKLWCSQKKKRKKEGEGVAPVKMCPNEECGYLMPPSTMICPGCGHFFEPEKKELAIGELIEITEKFNELRGRMISTLNAEELAIYARLKNKKAYAIRIATAHEQEQTGWLDKFRMAMNYKIGWLHYQLGNLPAEKIDYHDTIVK